MLDSNHNSLSAAVRSVHSALVCELALFGVSHYAPLLSTFNLNSIESLSAITDDALIEVSFVSFIFFLKLNPTAFVLTFQLLNFNEKWEKIHSIENELHVRN